MTNEEHYADYKWIKVKRHNDDPTASWEERYKVLEHHHLKETTFLIDEVRSLAKQLDEVTVSKHKLETDELRTALLRHFLIMWFGFSAIPALIIPSVIDQQTQHVYHNWIFGGLIIFGLTCSSILTYFVWKQENANSK